MGKVRSMGAGLSRKRATCLSAGVVGGATVPCHLRPSLKPYVGADWNGSRTKQLVRSVLCDEGGGEFSSHSACAHLVVLAVAVPILGSCFCLVIQGFRNRWRSICVPRWGREVRPSESCKIRQHNRRVIGRAVICSTSRRSGGGC